MIKLPEPLRTLLKVSDVPPALKTQVDLDNINFVSNDRLLEIMQSTTATPHQVAEAMRINEDARLRALKIGLSSSWRARPCWR